MNVWHYHAFSKPSTPLALTEIHVHALYRYVCKESCLGEKEVMIPLLPPPQLHQDGASQETLELGIRAVELERVALEVLI